MPFTGLTVQTAERIILDAGALYRNLDIANPDFTNPVGATRGGASFSVERDDREIEVDGARGPIMQLKRTIRNVATLEVTFLELSQQLLVDLTRGTAAVSGDDANLIEITPSNIIAPEDYIDNIALVADILNKDNPIIILLENILIQGEWSIETNDVDEGMLAMTFMAHYDLADLNDVPYKILFPADLES